MRILAALGGKAWRGRVAAAADQRQDVGPAADALAELTREHELVIVHDDEPQMLELALRNRLPERDIVSVLTGVVVAADDPAFDRPTKPIGPHYTEEQAQRLRRERGWMVGRDGDGHRRLVPSPAPKAIAEIRSLRALVDFGALVICVGGGTPIALDGDGGMHGVGAAIDRDLTAALLARRLDADLLLMLTDVEGEMNLTPGSMAPKVEAACRFAAGTGRRAAIGSLTELSRVARGEAGTQVLAPAAEAAIGAARRLPRR
ncbi:MAG TPA: carbamate kinase [Solirubrobacterales bacterium]|nr:carbamate kinase [Solirubrobacterales bacterium]